MVIFLFLSLIMSAPFLALLIVLSMIAPWRRWVSSFIALVWIVVVVIWSDHITTTSRPDYNEGPGGGLGVAFMAMATLGLAFGSVFYGIFRGWYIKRLADPTG